MPLPPAPSLLDDKLRLAARRYRLPEMTAIPSQLSAARPATTLAITIELARRAMVCGEVPDAALKRLFIEALAHMVREAMRTEFGDPAFQAMVLQHRRRQVREYASLSAHANQDRRSIHTAVNAIAHPAKLQRIPPGQQREELARLHASASSASWSDLTDTAGRLLLIPEIVNEPVLERGLTRLLGSPALERLRRLDALACDKLVLQYQSLRDQYGPRSGSPAAVAQGGTSQRRGAAVEGLAAQAVETLAQRLNESGRNQTPYRVVSSMRVPASISASHKHAKTEWDVVLLRQAKTVGAIPTWDVCLLVEAKASVDATSTDLPTLLRGLQLLASADRTAVYPFKTRQGIVQLRGASLNALPTDGADLARTVLYCCDAPAETTPRLLSAASRMQLLSTPACLEFASTQAKKQDADYQGLESVWHRLLESPQWGAVLNQYATLRQVRELMVHTEDLLIAAGSTVNN